MAAITTQRYNLALVETIVLIGLPIVLIMLPADFFDSGESVCLSVSLFDTECYGCGMTRSIMHLLHLDIEESIYYNALGIVVAPIIAIISLYRIKKNLSILKIIS